MLLATGPANAQTSGARIHLIHGIPGVNVDVIVDGKVVFANFAFKDTQDLSSFAGQTLKGLKVNAAGTADHGDRRRRRRPPGHRQLHGVRPPRRRR